MQNLSTAYKSVQSFWQNLPGGYWYGFNGMESDDEIKGEGKTYNYTFRLYDSRIGRFLTIDLLAQNFSMLSPYQFAGNTPIQAIDLDGMEGVKTVDHLTQTTTITLYILYVPNTVEDGNSGFSIEDVDKIQTQTNDYLSTTTFVDVENQDEYGNPYCVEFNIQYVPVSSKAEASKIQYYNKDRTAILSKGSGYWKVTSSGQLKYVEATTLPGKLNFSNMPSPHTTIHEISHLLAHWSNENQIRETANEINEKGEDAFHNTPPSEGGLGGGVFTYGTETPLNQENVNMMLENVKLVEDPALVIPK